MSAVDPPTPEISAWEPDSLSLSMKAIDLMGPPPEVTLAQTPLAGNGNLQSGSSHVPHQGTMIRSAPHHSLQPFGAGPSVLYRPTSPMVTPRDLRPQVMQTFSQPQNGSAATLKPLLSATMNSGSWVARRPSFCAAPMLAQSALSPRHVLSASSVRQPIWQPGENLVGSASSAPSAPQAPQSPRLTSRAPQSPRLDQRRALPAAMAPNYAPFLTTPRLSGPPPAGLKRQSSSSHSTGVMRQSSSGRISDGRMLLSAVPHASTPSASSPQIRLLDRSTKSVDAAGPRQVWNLPMPGSEVAMERSPSASVPSSLVNHISMHAAMAKLPPEYLSAILTEPTTSAPYLGSTTVSEESISAQLPTLQAEIITPSSRAGPMRTSALVPTLCFAAVANHSTDGPMRTSDLQPSPRVTEIEVLASLPATPGVPESLPFPLIADGSSCTSDLTPGADSLTEPVVFASPRTEIVVPERTEPVELASPANEIEVPESSTSTPLDEKGVLVDRKILFLCGDFMEDYEIMVPFQALKSHGMEVHAVCPGKKKGDACRTAVHDFEGDQTYTEKPGHSFTMNANFEDVQAADYHGLVIPGGRAPEYLAVDGDVIALVQEFARADKPIASMAQGQLILIPAGVLRGRACTAHHTGRPLCKLAGATWVDPEPKDIAVTDGNLVTAAGWVGNPEFIRQTVALLGVKVIGATSKRVLFLAGDFMEDYEIMVPFQALRSYGMEVHAVSPGRKVCDACRTAIHDFERDMSYSEKLGHSFILNGDFDDVCVNDYDALVIPGGRAPGLLALHPGVITLVQAFAEAQKLIASVGHGHQILTAADVLQGRSCTGYPTVGPACKLAGAIWVEPEPMHLAVTDGNLVTTATWAGLPEFIRQIVTALGVKVEQF